MNKEMTFTTLAELKKFLDTLSDAELNAATSSADWFEIYVHINPKKDRFYYHIDPRFGGEE